MPTFYQAQVNKRLWHARQLLSLADESSIDLVSKQKQQVLFESALLQLALVKSLFLLEIKSSMKLKGEDKPDSFQALCDLIEQQDKPVLNQLLRCADEENRSMADLTDFIQAINDPKPTTQKPVQNDNLIAITTGNETKNNNLIDLSKALLEEWLRYLDQQIRDFRDISQEY